MIARCSPLPLLAALFAFIAAIPAQSAVIDVGNGIYTVSVDDGVGSSFACGTWTATTGPLHPAGPGENVLYGRGNPGTSDTTVRSYGSGIDYRTGGGGSGCEDICAVALAQENEVLLRDGVPVGVRIRWILDDVLTTLTFEQVVIVEGPVDGTETTENTVIRETHTVINAGTNPLQVGLRKMWDWQIGFDDGPWLGECGSPTVACDRSMNLTADGTGGDAAYPPAVVINEEPAESGCPDPIVPNDADGCSGAPLYLVAATVSAGSGLDPAPTPPELYQFNNWGRLVSDCWLPTLADSANCGGGDTAAAYFYGLSDATAIDVPPGEERGFTQYVVAVSGECPSSFDPCDPVEPTVRTQGFWKRQCRGTHPSGEAERLEDYASVVGIPPFGDVEDAADVCDRLTPDPRQDKCEQAEAQFMALLLNIASDRVRTCNCVDDPDLGELTVGEVVAELSALLDDPDRSFEDCVLAQAVADRINNDWTLVDCPGSEDPVGMATDIGTLAPGLIERLRSFEGDAPSPTGFGPVTARQLLPPDERLDRAESARVPAEATKPADAWPSDEPAPVLRRER